MVVIAIGILTSIITITTDTIIIHTIISSSVVNVINITYIIIFMMSIINVYII